MFSVLTAQCTVHLHYRTGVNVLCTPPPTLLLYTPLHTLQAPGRSQYPYTPPYLPIMPSPSPGRVVSSQYPPCLPIMPSLSCISSPHTVKTLLPSTTGGINTSGHCNAVNGVSGYSLMSLWRIQPFYRRHLSNFSWIHSTLSGI